MEEGAFGCLMGPKTAKKTLLWFHGMIPSLLHGGGKDTRAAQADGKTGLKSDESDRRRIRPRCGGCALCLAVGSDQAGREEWPGAPCDGARIW